MSARSTPSSNGERKPPGILRDDADARVRNGEIPIVLPHERVFRIQIGSELFTLSGASLSSDGKQSILYLIIQTVFHSLLYEAIRHFAINANQASHISRRDRGFISPATPFC